MDVPVVPVLGLTDVPLVDVPLVGDVPGFDVDVPEGRLLPDGFAVVPVDVAPGFFVVVVAGVRFRVVGVVVDLLAGALLVGRDVLPPIIPPPVTPPSCWATATPAQADSMTSVNTNRNRGERGVIDMNSLRYRFSV